MDSLSRDEYIDLYNNPAMYDQWEIGIYHPRSRFLLEHVKGPDVLELGTGGSGFLRIIAENGWNITGVDINPKWIELGKERLPQVKYIHSLIETVDLEGSLYDTILLMEVLEHVIDPKLVLQKAHWHLKPEGQILITVPRAGGEFDFVDNHLRQFTWESLLDLLDEFSSDDSTWEDREFIYAIVRRQNGE